MKKLNRYNEACDVLKVIRRKAKQKKFFSFATTVSLNVARAPPRDNNKSAACLRLSLASLRARCETLWRLCINSCYCFVPVAHTQNTISALLKCAQLVPLCVCVCVGVSHWWSGRVSARDNLEQLKATRTCCKLASTQNALCFALCVKFFSHNANFVCVQNLTSWNFLFFFFNINFQTTSKHTHKKFYLIKNRKCLKLNQWWRKLRLNPAARRGQAEVDAMNSAIWLPWPWPSQVLNDCSTIVVIINSKCRTQLQVSWIILVRIIIITITMKMNNNFFISISNSKMKMRAILSYNQVNGVWPTSWTATTLTPLRRLQQVSVVAQMCVAQSELTIVLAHYLCVCACECLKKSDEYETTTTNECWHSRSEIDFFSPSLLSREEGEQKFIIFNRAAQFASAATTVSVQLVCLARARAYVSVQVNSRRRRRRNESKKVRVSCVLARDLSVRARAQLSSCSFRS